MPDSEELEVIVAVGEDVGVRDGEAEPGDEEPSGQ